MCSSNAPVQDQASSKVDAALRETSSELQHLAQLLTGQRMAAAVSLACASGDIRLAMLLSQVLPHNLSPYTAVGGAAIRLQSLPVTEHSTQVNLQYTRMCNS